MPLVVSSILNDIDFIRKNENYFQGLLLRNPNEPLDRLYYSSSNFNNEREKIQQNLLARIQNEHSLSAYFYLIGGEFKVFREKFPLNYLRVVKEYHIYFHNSLTGEVSHFGGTPLEPLFTSVFFEETIPRKILSLYLPEQENMFESSQYKLFLVDLARKMYPEFKKQSLFHVLETAFYFLLYQKKEASSLTFTLDKYSAILSNKFIEIGGIRNFFVKTNFLLN